MNFSLRQEKHVSRPSFPPSEIVLTLVRRAGHTVHQGLFRKELEQFVQLRKAIVLRMGLGIPADDDIGLGPGIYIDPAWLAQFCFMIG
jgi:hypothetical protein